MPTTLQPPDFGDFTWTTAADLDGEAAPCPIGPSHYSAPISPEMKSIRSSQHLRGCNGWRSDGRRGQTQIALPRLAQDCGGRMAHPRRSGLVYESMSHFKTPDIAFARALTATRPLWDAGSDCPFLSEKDISETAAAMQSVAWRHRRCTRSRSGAPWKEELQPPCRPHPCGRPKSRRTAAFVRSSSGRVTRAAAPGLSAIGSASDRERLLRCCRIRSGSPCRRRRQGRSPVRP